MFYIFKYSKFCEKKKVFEKKRSFYTVRSKTRATDELTFWYKLAKKCFPGKSIKHSVGL